MSNLEAEAHDHIFINRECLKYTVDRSAPIASGETRKIMHDKSNCTDVLSFPAQQTSQTLAVHNGTSRRAAVNIERSRWAESIAMREFNRVT